MHQKDRGLDGYLLNIKERVFKLVSFNLTRDDRFTSLTESESAGGNEGPTRTQCDGVCSR